MQLIGMILIASWAIIGILSPVLAYVYDKLRGVEDKDAMISTGRYDSRISAIQITIFSLPLLGVGVVLNAIGS